MASVGINDDTGEPITGWERTVQGLRICLETEVGERVQARDFGGRSESLVDRPQNRDILMEVFVTVQEAIEPRLVGDVWYGEPCFGLTRIRADLSNPGKPFIELVGVEYPNGHLGDFTTQTDNVRLIVPLEGIL